MNPDDSQSVLNQLEKLYEQQSRDEQLAEHLRKLASPTMPIDWHGHRIAVTSIDDDIVWFDVLDLSAAHCAVWMADLTGPSLRHALLGNMIGQRVQQSALLCSDNPMSLPEVALNQLNRDLRNIDDLPLLSLAIAVFDRSTRTVQLARGGAVTATLEEEESRSIAQAGPFLGTIDAEFFAEEVQYGTPMELTLATQGDAGSVLRVTRS